MPHTHQCMEILQQCQWQLRLHEQYATYNHGRQHAVIVALLMHAGYPPQTPMMMPMMGQQMASNNNNTIVVQQQQQQAASTVVIKYVNGMGMHTS